MNKTKRTALCGVMAALSVTMCLTAYFPYFTYAAPAAAGAVMMIPCIEADKKWAFFTYLSSAVIVMLVCEKEAACLYAGFFGYYLIIKAWLEGLRLNRVCEQILKQLIFSAASIISYLVIVYVFGIPFDENKKFGIWFLAAMLAAGNVVFAVYDIGISRIIGLYIYKFHNRVQKMLK